MKPLVIGIGNRDRGDDAVGPVLVDQLQRAGAALDTAYCAGDITRLLDLWHAREHVVLVDMLVTADQPAGTVCSFDVRQDPLPYSVAYSSHAMNLSQCVELARTLDQLPPRVALIGIVGAQTTPGAQLTPAVRKAVDSACLALTEELNVEAIGHA